MQKISPENLISFNDFEASEPVIVDLAYAKANHNRNIFKEAIYHENAQCWAHTEIVTITLLAARLVYDRYGWSLEIKDCLRTSDAQDAMLHTDVSKANPHWFEEPRLLSPPGTGAHPRAMAVDVHPQDKNGNLVDMGTPFDAMEAASARHYKDHDQTILDNRQNLENAFIESAKAFNADFIPYSEEWWDFRFSGEYYDQFAPLSDAELPPQMQMVGGVDTEIENLPDEHFERLAKHIVSLVDKAHENFS
ncbi:MAG: M15 family metallopeptidase [Pseudomonadota bacterium]